MPRPPSLTATQKKEVIGWFRAGATVDTAYERAKNKGWKVSRTTIGGLQPVAGASPPAEKAEEPPPTLAQLAEEVKTLRQALLTVPKVSLKEATTGAVVTATRISQDGSVEARVRVQALAVLPDLIRLAAEQAGGG